jgi:hypothetical protein
MILSGKQQMEDEDTGESEYDSGKEDLGRQRSGEDRLAVEDGVGIIAPRRSSASSLPATMANWDSHVSVWIQSPCC